MVLWDQLLSPMPGEHTQVTPLSVFFTHITTHNEVCQRWNLGSLVTSGDEKLENASNSLNTCNCEHVRTCTHTYTHVLTTINIPTLALIHVAESDSWCVLWSAHLQSLCKYIQRKYSIGRIIQHIFTSIVHSWRHYSLVFRLESTLYWFCYSSVCYVSFIRCFGMKVVCDPTQLHM